jgi:uncharacterized protein (DUF362 family)
VTKRLLINLAVLAICRCWLWLDGLPTTAFASDLRAGSFSNRARVVIVQDAQAISTFSPRPEKIEELVTRGMTSLTGKRTVADAWRSLVSTQDVIGIKVFSAPGAMSGTRPSVVAAIVQGLLSAGLPPKQILVWDKHLADLRNAGFFELAERYGVRVAGSAEEGYDEKDPYETALLGKLYWGDFEFGKSGEGIGRKSFVSKLVTQKMTRIIHVTPLLNHNLAGVSGNLYGLVAGSVDNMTRFEFSGDLLARAVPEIYALPQLGDRVVLNIVDGLLCQYQGEERKLHYSAMLGQIRFSKDPVALDVLSIEEINRQRQLAKIPTLTTNFQLYTNASLLEIGVSDLRKIEVVTEP